MKDAISPSFLHSGGEFFLLFELGLELGAGLLQLRFRLADVDAVQDVLQIVFRIEIADGLIADEGGEGAVRQPLHRGIDNGGDDGAEDGNALYGVSHGLDDGISHIQAPKPEGDEGISDDCDENFCKPHVRGAEAVQKDEVLYKLRVDGDDERGVDLFGLRDGGIHCRAHGTLHDEGLCRLLDGALVENGQRLLDRFIVPRIACDGEFADEFTVIPPRALDFCGEIDHLVGDVSPHLAVVPLGG